MATAIQFDRIGGPEVLYSTAVEVGEPGPGQVRLRVQAIGTNHLLAVSDDASLASGRAQFVGNDSGGLSFALGEVIPEQQCGRIIADNADWNGAGAEFENVGHHIARSPQMP